MTNLQAFLEESIRKIMSGWHENDIYVISFFVYANESYKYNGYTNVTEFSIGYNTDSYCEYADTISERRWDYAFWKQNEVPIIEATEEDIGMKVLFDWYEENGINNIGYEDYNNCYNEKMEYIGRGPNGYYELLSEVAKVAKRLQESGYVREMFGRPTPIIIHELEYSWYIIEANKEANPNGEADSFFATLEMLGVIN